MSKVQLKSGFRVETNLEVNEYIEAVYQYVIYFHMPKSFNMYVTESTYIYHTESQAITAGLKKITELCNETIQEIQSIKKSADI